MTNDISRTGFILYVEKYEAGVTFYRNILGIKTLFDTEGLTCFEFGGSYLMVEKDDPISDKQRALSHTSCLRMNVADVNERVRKLVEYGVEVDYQEDSWGTVAKFQDPDGNLCASKDNGTFEEQIRVGRSSLVPADTPSSRPSTNTQHNVGCKTTRNNPQKRS